MEMERVKENIADAAGIGIADCLYWFSEIL
jgi:hypothetical protein